MSMNVSLRSPPVQLSKKQQELRLLMSQAGAAGAGDDDHYDEADQGSRLSKEEERERKAAVQARIRKEQAEGPPPDMSKRAVSGEKQRERGQWRSGRPLPFLAPAHFFIFSLRFFSVLTADL